MSIESVMPSNHLTLCLPFSSCLQSFPASGSFQMSHFFASGDQSIWASASASVYPMNWINSGLISFRIDWFDILAVQGTLKSLLQHHGSKALILQHSNFFTVQLSHPYMTTGKTIAVTRWNFAGKVTSLLFNMLSNFSSKEHTSFNFMAAVIICSNFGVQENKASHCFPIYLPLRDGPDAMIFVFWMLSFKPTFHCPLSLSSRGSSVLLHFLS